MQVNKTVAAKLAGISRRSFYNHIKEKGISTVQDGDGNEMVDVAELERVYGLEKVKKNLRIYQEGQGNDQEDGGANGSADKAPAGARAELMLLKERVKHLEEQKEQIEKFQFREREQFESQIANLQKNLEQALEQSSKLGLLLTDQRDQDKKTDTQRDEKLEALQSNVQKLGKQNQMLLRELREKKRGFWERLLSPAEGRRQAANTGVGNVT